MKHYDMVVIGSGAGLLVLEEALNHGLHCAIIEKGKLGGTCLTKGCIPSKMLVYPADLIRAMEAADRIGIQAGQPQIDWQTISGRMWQQIDFHQAIEKNLQDIPNLTLYKGIGSFTSPDSMTIRYDDGRPDESIHGEKFVIAAGARSIVPAIEGLEETGYLTSESFFGPGFPSVPWKSLVLVGGGAISAEFAHIFSAFGTQVTIIEKSDRILGKEEPEISAFITQQFQKNKVTVLTDSTVVSTAKADGMKYVTVEDTLRKQQTTIACEEIFVAAGIQSNVDMLAIEQAKVETDQNGWIITNPCLETSQKNIWALGDINGKYQFRHKANYEAQILMQNLFDGEEKKEVSYQSVPWAIFTHPQVAHLGATEKELKEQGIPYHTAKNYYSEVVGGRAMGYRKNDADNGFVKMIVSENKEILGVHIVGPQASVLLQPFVYLMNTKYQCKKKLRRAAEINGLRLLCPQIGTYTPINDSMVIHPSLSELTAWVFEKLDWPE